MGDGENRGVNEGGDGGTGEVEVEGRVDGVGGEDVGVMGLGEGVGDGDCDGVCDDNDGVDESVGGTREGGHDDISLPPSPPSLPPLLPLTPLAPPSLPPLSPPPPPPPPLPPSPLSAFTLCLIGELLSL